MHNELGSHYQLNGFTEKQKKTVITEKIDSACHT